MNQEYLWSKTGSDAELEKLEGLLSEFRFDGKSTVEQPATNTIPVAAVPKRRFVLALSFAASAAMIVLMTIWLIPPRNAPVAKEEPKTESVPDAVESRNGDGIQYALVERAKTDASNQERLHFSRTQTKQHASKLSRGQVTKTAKENLTKEEKYAYDRLMFALSIAGSKLRVVQDTIDRKGDAGSQSIRNEK
jgi:hypothetical protein